MKKELTYVNTSHIKGSGREILMTWVKDLEDNGYYQCDFYDLLEGARNEDWLTMDVNLQECTKFYSANRDYQGNVEVTVEYTQLVDHSVKDVRVLKVEQVD